MNKLYFEHRMPAPDTIELCPRCKAGLVFRPQPDVAYCPKCGGINGKDQGITYVRKTE